MAKLTNPTTHASHYQLPFVCISHHNFPAFAIVRCDSHFGNIVRTTDIQCFIDFIFDRQTMTIPSETPFDMIALLMRIPCDHIFNGSSQNVTIMRQSRCKRRPIVKSVTANTKIRSNCSRIPCGVTTHRKRRKMIANSHSLWLSFRLLQTFFKHLIFRPILQCFLFLFRKVNILGDTINFIIKWS